LASFKILSGHLVSAKIKAATPAIYAVFDRTAFVKGKRRIACRVGEQVEQLGRNTVSSAHG
jgi:hypothetical protein